MLKLRNFIFYLILFFQSNHIFSAPRQRQITHKNQKQRQVTVKKRHPQRIIQKKKTENTSSRIIKPNRQEHGVYLGIFNYGKAISKDPCKLFFNFYCNGEIKRYRIIKSKSRYLSYVLNNRLQEGYLYKIQFLNDRIVNLIPADRLSYFVEGTITRISQDRIFINNKPYVYHSNLVRKIVCEPGGAKIIIQRLML